MAFRESIRRECMSMLEYGDLIGVPFVGNGRSKETGFDCYGLVQEMFRRAGRTLPDYTADFKDVQQIDALIRENAATEANWRKVPKHAEIPVPCVMAIRFGVPRGVVNHTGCYIGEGKFIHARENIGVCVDRIDSPAWRGVIEGVYEYVGDADGETGHH